MKHQYRVTFRSPSGGDVWHPFSTYTDEGLREELARHYAVMDLRALAHMEARIETRLLPEWKPVSIEEIEESKTKGIRIGSKVTLKDDAIVGDWVKSQVFGRIGTVVAEEPAQSHFTWAVKFEGTSRQGGVFAFCESDLHDATEWWETRPSTLREFE